eukprot:1139050-Pelagomonas_calceolata.AAC.5
MKGSGKKATFQHITQECILPDKLNVKAIRGTHLLMLYHSMPGMLARFHTRRMACSSHLMKRGDMRTCATTSHSAQHTCSPS